MLPEGGTIVSSLPHSFMIVWQSHSPSAVAMQCVGVLSRALGNSWKGPAASLIEPTILTGLSSTLVQSLQVRILSWGEGQALF